jgi:hypothetical protein
VRTLINSSIEDDALALERQLKVRVEELERRRIEAEKAEAEAIYEATRYQPQNEHNFSRDGVELAIDQIARHNLEPDAVR